ncbi:MAG: bifunctional glutamine-synthetase adenylyltransferase/deadenyltransferase, partial [Bowdeniella nasicola]|nr:bifunctional glutamine-synthetase adenylyltransferase/deadenyltransferase [Bowdeniella nasicola]
MTSLIARARSAGALNPTRAVQDGEVVLEVCFGAHSADHESLLGELIDDLRGTASPDDALSELVRLAREHSDIIADILTDATKRALLLRIIGASGALADIALRDPQVLTGLDRVEQTLISPFTFAPHPDSFPAAVTALRAQYRRHLWAIAAADLAMDDYRTMPSVAQAITRLVHETLRVGLHLARREHPETNDALIVVALGKSGGMELNYISDVDIICVSKSEQSADLAAVSTVVKTLRDICSHRIVGVDEVPLWPLDMNLRPEGRDGPLVKTLSAHRHYYAKWAETWEFQALLKARPIAGDQELQTAYETEIWPRAFHAVERENFVADTQHMRMRVEASLTRNERGRHIKLGAGGLRDVEFTVQLLQLVHARTDATLRRRGTIPAISALCAGGYISREA